MIFVVMRAVRICLLFVVNAVMVLNTRKLYLLFFLLILQQDFVILLIFVFASILLIFLVMNTF